MRLITYYRLIKWHVLTWSKLLISREDLIKPYKMMVSVTNLCNSRCKTCFIWQEGINSDSSIQEFDLDDIEKVFDLLADSLLWLSFTGGEPVLKIEKIRVILNLAKNKCPNLSLVAFTTNGYKLPKRAQDFHTPNLGSVSAVFSIASWPETCGALGSIRP